MSNHIMVDLETLGTRPGSIILSVGAVRFGPDGLLDDYYSTISVSSSRGVGLVSDPSTERWWASQNKEARDAALAGGRPIKEVLTELSSFIGKFAKVWGNGSAFDNVILKAAYGACGISVPWKYYDDCCYRTMKTLFPHIEMDSRVGIHHNALDDAKSQALHLCKILNHLYSKGAM